MAAPVAEESVIDDRPPYEIALEELAAELAGAREANSRAALRAPAVRMAPRATGGLPANTRFQPPIQANGELRNTGTEVGSFVQDRLNPMLGDAGSRLAGDIASRGFDVAEGISKGTLGFGYEMTGIPGMQRAATNLADAVETGDALRGGAAIGQGALSILPMRLPGTVVEGLTQGALRVGIPMAASTALMPIPAFAGEAEVMKLQQEMRDAGLYTGPIDGKMGGKTQEAAKQYNQLKKEAAERAIEERRIGAQEAESKRLTDENAQRIESNRIRDERLRNAEKDMDPVSKAIRDYGPMAGYIVGMGLGGGIRGTVLAKSNRMMADRVARANSIMAQGSGDWPSRAANVNQFWSEGAPSWLSRLLSREVAQPFTAAPGRSPPYVSAPNATPSGQLYQPGTANRMAVDAGVVGTAGAESTYFQMIALPAAEKEVEESRAAMQLDPSVSNVGRYQTALANRSIAEGMMNMGRASAGTYAGASLYKPRDKTRPNVGIAEAERMRVDEQLNRRAASGAPRAPTPLLPAGPARPLLSAPTAATAAEVAQETVAKPARKGRSAAALKPSPDNVPEGHTFIANGRGSKLQKDGRFTKMPDKQQTQMDDMRPMGGGRRARASEDE